MRAGNSLQEQLMKSIAGFMRACRARSTVPSRARQIVRVESSHSGNAPPPKKLGNVAETTARMLACADTKQQLAGVGLRGQG